MADIKKELNDIKTAIYGKDVRGSIHDGIDKINKESEESKQKASEAHDVMESIINDGFDNAALEANFEQKLDDKISQLQPEWTQFQTDVTSQLNEEVQQRENDISDINAKKASKIEMQNGLSSKVGKGENESVSWGMLDQTAKENISSGQVAVVGEDSVNSINLVDRAASFAKRTALGSMAIVQTGSNIPAPNINTKSKKVKYYEGTYLSYGKYRYGLEEDIELDMITGAGAVMQNVFIDTSSNTLSILTGSSTVNQSTENQLLVTSINWDSNQMEKLKQVVINGRYSVDGMSYVNKELDSYISPTELGLVSFGDPRTLAKFNYDQGTLILPQPFYISYKNKRYDFYGEEETVINLPNNRNFLIFYDEQSNSFITHTTANIRDGQAKNKILIATSFQEVVNMSCGHEITSSVIPDKVNRYRVMDVSVEGLYSSNEQFEDYSDFDSVKTSSVLNMFDNLVSVHSDVLTKEIHGDISTGQPFVSYTLTPKYPQSDYYGKIPEIYIKCGIHGYEHANTLVTYLALRQILERWEESEHLELLRFNTKMTIVPVSNPWGWDNFTRKNENGVDLNRNFPSSGWVSGDYESSVYGGEYPASELATQYMMEIMQNNNLDIMYDFHNFRALEPDDQFIWIPTGRGREQRLAMSLISAMTRKWSKDFDFVDSNIFVGYTNKTLAGGTTSEFARERGVPFSSTIEVRDRWVKDNELGLYSQRVCKAGVETLVNWLILNIKELVK